MPLVLIPVHLLFFAFLIIFAYFTFYKSTQASMTSSTSLLDKDALIFGPVKVDQKMTAVPFTLKLSSSTNSLPDDICERQGLTKVQINDQIKEEMICRD